MADIRDLTVTELKEILYSHDLAMARNKSEMVLCLKEENGDRIWISNYCKNCTNYNSFVI